MLRFEHSPSPSFFDKSQKNRTCVGFALGLGNVSVEKTRAPLSGCQRSAVCVSMKKICQQMEKLWPILEFFNETLTNVKVI